MKVKDLIALLGQLNPDMETATYTGNVYIGIEERSIYKIFPPFKKYHCLSIYTRAEDRPENFVHLAEWIYKQKAENQ